MTPDRIRDAVRQALGKRLLDDRIVERSVGTNTRRAIYDLWLTVPPDALHDAVAELVGRFAPHFTVISGDDLGESISFIYHFTVGWGERFGEVSVNLRTTVEKANLRLPTLTDLIPGAQTSEREKHEFYGLEVLGIPDDRNLFLPEDSTIHPWRKDLEGETERFVHRAVEWEATDE
ncbi:MAG: NADH-quinone oxidoreductase subunit C [Candidatus Bipolaricaulota bacterium]